MFFHRTPRLVQQLYPSLTWSIKTKKNKIFLTFDDGPIPRLTEFVLDTLDQFNVKGTFFCVGENINRNGEIAHRAISEGHQLGNHTFSHLNGWKHKTSEYIQDFNKCQHTLEPFGQENKLFRPPYGRLRRLQMSKIKKDNQIVMWDVLTGDYSNEITPANCLTNSIKATKPGSIVLFHDNIKAERNITYALPRFIEHFKKRDYDFGLI